MGTSTCLLVLLAAVSMTGASVARDVNSPNPIRRVVTMLQMMQDKVTKEGEKEQKLFDKYMCYCDKSHNVLTQSITVAEAKLPQLENSIKENQAEHDRLKGDIEQAKNDRRDAADSLAAAQALSDKELAKLNKDIDQYRSNIKALEKAIAALDKGRVDAFLQSSAVAQFRVLMSNLDMSPSNRDVISSFLSTDKSDDEYKPNPSEISGILQQMMDQMQEGLENSIAGEKDETEQAAAMTKSKNEQISALSKQIEVKTQRVGELGVDIANFQGDYDDTAKSLDEDKLLLEHLDNACELKQKHWNERTRIRGDELMAITMTIKTLNDDDTLTLFKKTMPSPTFLQVAHRHGHRRASGDGTREKAMNALQEGVQRGQHRSQMQAISMAMRNKRATFEKIIKMIDQMVDLLKSEEGTDIKKKEYCNKEIGTSENQVKALTLEASDMQKAIEEGKTKLAAISEEVSALAEGITDLDGQVKESTRQRKEEHAEFVEKLSLNAATQDLLALAKNLLNKFYNPKVYEDPQPAEEPFFVQVAASKRKQMPGKPPNADIISASYDKKAGGGGKVIDMIDQLSKDVTKETSESQADEKAAQTSYEEAIEEAAAKRAVDARSIAEKEAVKAELETRLHKMIKGKKVKTKEASGLTKYLQALHSECDWILANFDARLEARDAEVKSLRDAKAVLSGGDYSLQQRGSTSQVSRPPARHLRRLS